MSRYSADRFVESGIPDLRDNLEAKKAPAMAVQEAGPFANTYKLMERFAPRALQEELLQATAALPNGRHRARLKAGAAEDGTKHVHDYIVDKDETGVAFYFVDPEHMMGANKKRSKIKLPRKSDFKPKITNLLGIRINTDPAVSSDFFALRFRTDAFENHQLFKSDHMLEVAEQVLKTGEIPEMLKGHENEIIWRLSVQSDKAVAQGRYADTKDLTRFLRGETPTAMLRGRIKTQRVLVNRFLRHTQNSTFTPIEESKKVIGQDGDFAPLEAAA
ncbi:MAG: hypothetical protein V4437_01775 [Patescibacteria group bacterium]